VNATIVTERLEDLRAQLCGINGQAHKLNREIQGIQNLTRQFPDSGTDLAITLKGKLVTLVLLLDALALSTLQLEQYVRWSGDILAGIEATNATNLEVGSMRNRKPSHAELGSGMTRRLRK
jgi:hypothetical protein